MTDSGTHFPPQIYSSVYNPNVMIEDQDGIAGAVSSKEGNSREPDEDTSIRDCFTSSMDWKIPFLMLICCLVNTQAICCTVDDAPRTREFPSLAKFQGNSISFNYFDEAYAGSIVNFSAESIESLPRNSFITYTSEYITGINLSGKSIKSIDDGAFMSLSCLFSLDLSYNLVSNLSTNMFLNLSNLRTLNIRNNNLTYVPPTAFSNMKILRRLDLSHNNIIEMDKFAFDGIPALEMLDLSHNSMKHIRNYYFNNLTRLRELRLEFNSLAVLYTSLFSKNTRLETLDLSGNGLILLYISKDSFNPKVMQVFNLSNNYFMDLNIFDIVSQFSNSKTIIDLNDNQFYCKEWKQYSLIFKENNVVIAPGRNFTAKRHINGIACDNLNFTLPPDYDEEMESLQKDLSDEAKHFNDTDDSVFQAQYRELQNHFTLKKLVVGVDDGNFIDNKTSSVSKPAIIFFSIIGLAFCILSVIDYVLGLGIRRRLFRRISICLNPTPTDTSIASINSFDYLQLQSS